MLLKNARLASGQPVDLLLKNGLIAAMGLDLAADGEEVLDCAGRTLLPAVPGAVLTRRAGGRTWREEGLLAAFCTGGAGEGWTLLLGSGLAGRMGL